MSDFWTVFWITVVFTLATLIVYTIIKELFSYIRWRKNNPWRRLNSWRRRSPGVDGPS